MADPDSTGRFIIAGDEIIDIVLEIADAKPAVFVAITLQEIV